MARPDQRRRGALAALLLCAAGLPACDPGGPNGRDGVLFFLHEAASPYVGDTFRIGIPDHFRHGDYWMGKGLYYYARTFDFDFAGTTLEATTPVGVTVLSTALDADGWSVSLRCDAPVRGDLAVRVLAGGEVRYADRTYVECYAR
jgi:hypothetical protein